MWTGRRFVRVGWCSPERRWQRSVCPVDLAMSDTFGVRLQAAVVMVLIVRSLLTVLIRAV
jgi:hypothetical protein